MIEQAPSPTITYHTVTLGELARDGLATAEVMQQDAAGVEQLQKLHVPAGLPGERVTIGVEAPPQKRPGKRHRHWKQRPPRVWISEIHQSSPLRTTAPCPVFGICGGCQLQHMQYAAQLAWKRAVVAQLLHNIGGFTDPPLLETVACDYPWHYRNHMRFSVNRSGQPGLTARNTHRVLPLCNCPIAEEPINQALDLLAEQVNERPQLLIRCGTATGEMLIQPPPTDAAREVLTTAGLNVQTETLAEQLAGETFRIRPSSFFQTNTAQAEKMVRMVLEGLLADADTSFNEHEQSHSTSTRTVIDAYCGVGTFALVLAKHFERIIAIEESPSAIKDAQWNLRHVNNVEILKGKVETVLPTLAGPIHGLVIDPPRAGCQQVVLDALINNPVDRLVYVSCEPTTLARDLNILCHHHSTYQLHSLQPLDMFPQTAHIECIAILKRSTATS